MDVVKPLVNIKEGVCLCVYVGAYDFLLVFAFTCNPSSIQSALHFLGLFINGDPAKCTVEYYIDIHICLRAVFSCVTLSQGC